MDIFGGGTSGVWPIDARGAAPFRPCPGRVTGAGLAKQAKDLAGVANYDVKPTADAIHRREHAQAFACSGEHARLGSVADSKVDDPPVRTDAA